MRVKLVKFIFLGFLHWEFDLSLSIATLLKVLKLSFFGSVMSSGCKNVRLHLSIFLTLVYLRSVPDLFKVCLRQISLKGKTEPNVLRLVKI